MNNTIQLIVVAVIVVLALAFCGYQLWRGFTKGKCSSCGNKNCCKGK